MAKDQLKSGRKIDTEHLKGEDALKLAEGQHRPVLGQVVPALGDAGEGRTGQACTRCISVPINRSMWPPNRGVAGGRYSI